MPEKTTAQPPEARRTTYWIIRTPGRSTPGSTRQETDDPHSLTIRDDFCTLPDLWVAFRLYLEPGTAVGPAFAEILYDRVIVFRPKE